MDVLQVSPFLGSPSMGGAEQRIHGFAEGRKNDDRLNRIVVDTYDELNYKEIRDVDRTIFDDQYEEIRVKNFSKSVLNFFGSLSKIQEMKFLWMALAPELMHTYRTKPILQQASKADCVVVDFPWEFSYIRNQVEESKPVIYSSHNVETEYHQFLNDSRFGSALLKRFETIEEKAVNNSNFVVTTTKRDRDRFIDKYEGETEYIVAPNATFRENIRQPQISEIKLRNSEKDTTALFVGTNHPPNVSAVEHILSFAGEVSNTIQFRIVGNVNEAFMGCDIPPNVKFDGYVRDLDPVFANSSIALNPMTEGSGSNVKLPEYLAKGIPVLTTPFGARGVPEEGKDCMLITPIEEFSTKLQEVTKGRYDLEDLAKRGINLVDTSLNWEASWTPVWDRLRELM